MFPVDNYFTLFLFKYKANFLPLKKKRNMNVSTTR